MTPLLRRPFKSTLAALCALGLAFSATLPAAPARADDDVAKILAGIAAIYIAREAIKSKRERKVAPSHQRARPVARVAPQQCLRDQWTHRGVRQVYGARCMERRAAVQPPRACLQQAQTNAGPRRFYTQRCLRRNGWRS